MRLKTSIVIMRSYQLKCTRTHRHPEVKSAWAEPVLSMGTRREASVTHGFANRNKTTPAVFASKARLLPPPPATASPEAEPRAVVEAEAAPQRSVRAHTCGPPARSLPPRHPSAVLGFSRRQLLVLAATSMASSEARAFAGTSVCTVLLLHAGLSAYVVERTQRACTQSDSLLWSS